MEANIEVITTEAELTYTTEYPYGFSVDTHLLGHIEPANGYWQVIFHMGYYRVLGNKYETHMEAVANIAKDYSDFTEQYAKIMKLLIEVDKDK